MKEQIQYLITFHTQAKEEVYSLLNEINKVSDKDISEEDRTFKIRLEKEYDMRSLFISELQSVL